MTAIKKSLYKILTLTNLHVGSGDNSYGLVDKLVQRDPINGFPIIHATGMKGALKDYCRELLGKVAGETEKQSFPKMQLTEEQQMVFGDDEQEGRDKFFSAHLLTMPVRGLKKPWYNATCPFLIEELSSLLKGFGFDTAALDAIRKISLKLKRNDFLYFSKTVLENMVIEDTENGLQLKPTILDNYIKQWIGDPERLVILQDELFMELTENLPVVARNRLDDERNLWYEEFVPRESVFVFVHFTPNFSDETHSNVMETIVENTKNAPIQIGANASVDFGYCTIEPII